MDEETLFTGRGAPTRAHVETFSKREGQRVGWAERLQLENRDQGGPDVVLTYDSRNHSFPVVSG